MDRDLACLSLTQHKDGAWREIKDQVTPEQAVFLNWPDRPRIRLWAYPEDLENLVLGHARLELCGPGQAARLVARTDHEFWLEPVPLPSPARTVLPGLGAKEVLQAMGEFMTLPGRWRDTGCFHRAALYCPESRNFPRQAEDIGRHNCLDRLAGWLAGSGLNPACLGLFVTARATASLTAKAAKSGYKLMVSRSAVTTAAIDIAKQSAMTLLGFSRENRFTVFCDPKSGII